MRRARFTRSRLFGQQLTTVSTVVILELGKTSPLVGRDVLAVVQQPFGNMMQSQLEVLLAIPGELIKVQPRQRKVTRRPEPCRTLVIVPTLGDRLIVRIVRVVVITSVSGIGRVERPHPQGGLQVLVGQFERDHRPLRGKELGGVVHGDGEVGSELVGGGVSVASRNPDPLSYTTIYLVIRPFPVLGSTVDILVDTSTVDHAGVDIKRGVLFRVLGNPVTPLKVGLKKISPLLVSDALLLAFDCDVTNEQKR